MEIETHKQQFPNPNNTVIRSEMKLNGELILRDGRKLGYAEYGDSLGIPVFYFHGGQESRLSSAFMHSEAQQMGIRIISPERPGIGLSSFQPNREFLDWPDDIEQLADDLNIDQFSIFGLSGGAPHVLACLSKIPDRVINASIVCGAAPYNFEGSLDGMWPPVRMLHWLAKKENNRGLKKFLQMDYKQLVHSPMERMKQFQNYLPRPDREIMKANPAFGWEFIDGSIESYSQGIEGVAQEWQLYVHDWGFDLNSIDHPISLWFGTEDKMAPIERANYLNNNLRNSELTLIENEGHFSLIRNHLTSILGELLTNSKMGNQND